MNAVAVNGTIRDFGGFAQILFHQRHPAPGNAALAQQIADLIEAAGLPAGITPRAGWTTGPGCP